MNKNMPLIALLLLVLALFPLVTDSASLQQGTNLHQPTNAQVDSTNALNGSSSFLFSPRRDLRRLLDTKETISGRESRSVCYLEMYGLPLGKAEDWAKSGEVPIREGDTVRSVLDKAGFKRWAGGQPQVRLVNKNSITQSPLTEDANKVDTGSFLGLAVKPGDMIVIATVE